MLVALAYPWSAHLVRREQRAEEIVLYGNVDIRQIELPFVDSERIAEVMVREGDRVRAGEVIAKLETQRLQLRILQAEARAASQSESLRRLKNGTRPQERAQARAALAAAQAEAANARSQYQRLLGVSGTNEGAVSEQDLDAARAAAEMSEARVESNRKALDLALAGPREEDIA
ncbi:MAG TPA: biotin/lipoyl-binding protein [Steroidobacter sp.]|nr:biotin/lipoyl-binding protein [Steroidobacter sp.]